MRFFIMKEFRGGDPAEYLRNSFTSVLRNLHSGLSQLTFAENFKSFTVQDLVIAAGATEEIRNDLGNTEVPSLRLILRQSGGGAIIDGVTAWSSEFVYLTNTGGTDATVTAIFFR